MRFLFECPRADSDGDPGKSNPCTQSLPWFFSSEELGDWTTESTEFTEKAGNGNRPKSIPWTRCIPWFSEGTQAAEKQKITGTFSERLELVRPRIE
jgi:hypothetical protein